jgi:hypothetical protein
MGPMCCPEMSVRNDHYSLFNNPEEPSSQVCCDLRICNTFLYRVHIPAEFRRPINNVLKCDAALREI